MGVKSNRLEGSGFSKLVQAIRRAGYNRDTDVILGTILAPPPSIVIRPDGIGFDLDADDVVIAEHLTQHERTMRLKSGTTSETYVIDSPLSVGDRVFIVVKDNEFYVIEKAVV